MTTPLSAEPRLPAPGEVWGHRASERVYLVREDGRGLVLHAPERQDHFISGLGSVTRAPLSPAWASFLAPDEATWRAGQDEGGHLRGQA